MTRRRSAKSSSTKPLKELNQTSNVLQSHKYGANTTNNKHEPDPTSQSGIEGIERLKSILDDDEPVNETQPGTSSAATTTVENFTTDAAALYNELDSFRLRWKRELEVPRSSNHQSDTDNPKHISKQGVNRSGPELKENSERQSSSSDRCNATLKESFAVNSDPQNDPKEIYTLAKKLFLIGVELEENEMHHESIRYYKQAVHLCPEIEKQIFREQCEASARANLMQQSSERPNSKQNNKNISDKHDALRVEPEDTIALLDKVRQSYCDDPKNNNSSCRPYQKVKPGQFHISQLPNEIISKIFRHVIGQELDLASLESLGMVCRGLFLFSRDQILWKSICMNVWGDDVSSLAKNCTESSKNNPRESIDWRQLYIENPRVNYDGIYISRTRYIRQGDVGFQDITYRPFHVIRYYRYLRFFPNRRVLILTTNEEPERIVPIFRHAIKAKQFSSEFSILEGTYEFSGSNEVSIVADKDCRNIAHVQGQNQANRRQAPLMWSRQTPLAQRFNLKFELKTLESRPYRNNVLKWLEYTIFTRLETGQEITTFDLNPDTFPNLLFSRVRRFNLKSAEPLA